MELGSLPSDQKALYRLVRDEAEKGAKFEEHRRRALGVTCGGLGSQRHYPLIALEGVAGKTRVMEDRLIAKAGNDVTQAIHDYLAPLLGSGLPEVARLRMIKVAKAAKK
jgi:ATP-dependent phosphofructokinase / diphosphate-dependent phosphofructokinase